MAVQFVLSLLFLYSGRTKGASGLAYERAGFLPVSVDAMTRHQHLNDSQGYSDHRWSRDSGQGTERSSTHNSRDISPTDAPLGDDHIRHDKPEAPADEEDEEEEPAPNRGFSCSAFVDKYLSTRIPAFFPKRLQKVLEAVYEGIDRLILVLGFIALSTGGVTYAGIFVRCRSPGAGHSRKLTFISAEATSSAASHTLSREESSFGMAY